MGGKGLVKAKKKNSSPSIFFPFGNPASSSLSLSLTASAGLNSQGILQGIQKVSLFNSLSVIIDKMDKKQFSIDWQNFQTFTFDTFKDLRCDEYFLNVTLVCDDGKQFDAHKLILSSSSSVFHSMLTGGNKQAHPIIYLRGTNGKDVQRVLDFMYLGQVEVPENDIDDFLALAKDLKVKGMTETWYDKAHNEKREQSKQNHGIRTEESNSLVAQKSVAPPQNAGTTAEERECLDIIKTLEKLPKNLVEYSVSVRTTTDTDTEENIEQRKHMEVVVKDEEGEETEEILLELTNQENEKYEDSPGYIKANGIFICNVCGKMTKKVEHAKDHAETHRTDKTFTCEHCNESYKTKASLKQHVSKYCKVVGQFRPRKISISRL